MIFEMGISKISLAIVTRLKNISLKEGRLLIRSGSNINEMLKMAVAAWTNYSAPNYAKLTFYDDDNQTLTNLQTKTP